MSILFLLITLGTIVTVLGHREESLRKFKTEISNQFLTSFFLLKLNSSNAIAISSYMLFFFPLWFPSALMAILQAVCPLYNPFNKKHKTTIKVARTYIFICALIMFLNWKTDFSLTSANKPQSSLVLYLQV